MQRHHPAPDRAALRLLLVLVLALLACGDEEPGEAVTGLTADEFIEVVVELREAELAVAEEDSAAEMFALRKSEILERHGTTEQEIQTFTQAASRDLQGVEEIWEEISDRLRRPMGPDSAVDSIPPTVADPASDSPSDSLPRRMP